MKGSLEIDSRPDGLSTLVKLDSMHIDDAAGTLARAFWDYPLNRYFYPDTKEREQVALLRFKSAVRQSVFYGEAYATSDFMEGVALWLPSRYLEINFWQRIRCGDIGRRIKLSKASKEREKIFHSYAYPLHRQLVPEDHMFLWIIGVRPEFQKSGFSSRLIKPMLSRLSDEKSPCFLETHDEKNVSLYQHLGFNIIDESMIPGTSLKHWAMGTGR
jgi:GNAT superfamily N-acetyltransferase